MIRHLADTITTWAGRLAAVVLCVAPGRYWARFHSIPMANAAAASALATILGGAAIGASGYFTYMRPAVAGTNVAAFNVAEKQVRGEARDVAEVGMPTLRMLSMLSFFGFALFTPTGLISIYIVVSGCLRLGSYVVEDPMGDPLLTGIDALVRRLSGATRSRWRREQRERQEGREVPDRLVTGAWVGVPSADYVVISSRRKADWTRGMFILTADTWYRLGEPFDLRQPDGLRTAYPLTALQTTEVLRHGVRYELPPLEQHGKKQEFTEDMPKAPEGPAERPRTQS